MFVGGLTFLAPWSLLIAGLIAVPGLMLLYFLKLRRRPVRVPSTRLWRAVNEETEVNTPFQRLRLTPLFLLQFLALLCLVLALGRPAVPGLSVSGDRLILVIDHSSVMNLTDTAEGVTRLEKARSMARDLAARFDGTSGVMVVAMGRQAQVVTGLTRDRRTVREAIESIRPTDTVARLGPLAALLEPYLAVTGDGEGSTVVYVLGSGVFGDDVRPMLPRAEVVFHPVGGEVPLSADSVIGISAFSARRLLSDPTQVQFYLRVSQFGSSPREVSIELTADDQWVQTLLLEIPAGGDGRPGEAEVLRTLEAPIGVELAARIMDMEVAKRYHEAALVLRPPPDPRVLLVGPVNPLLRQAIFAAGVERLWQLTEEQYEFWVQSGTVAGMTGLPTLTEVDLMVFEGTRLSEVPPVNSLFFGAVPPIEQLALVDEAAGQRVDQFFLDWDRDHPLLRSVMLEEVTVESPGRLTLPPAGRTLIEGPAGPAMALIEHEGRRFVVASFRLTAPERGVRLTDWTIQTGFPIFIENVVRFLTAGMTVTGVGTSGGPGGDDGLVSAMVTAGGPPLLMPGWEGAEQVVWQGPEPVRVRMREGTAVWPSPALAGVYRADREVPTGRDSVAVQIESAGAFDPELREELSLVNTQVRTVQSENEGRRELWPWLIAVALGLILLEWLVYLRQVNR